jgi:polyketide biosynthesis enoyl-CoA hydratase PksH
MEYKTIMVNQSLEGIKITMNRAERQNSLNRTLLEEINRVLNQAEKKPDCRMVILEGQSGIFCTGQDFEEVSSYASKKKNHREIPEQEKNNHPGQAKQVPADPYMETLKRFTSIPKVVISVIDGLTIAGGVGLAAASDLVIATSRSRFSLSEALWGLLPAIVFPFLVRRVGFQAAYRMMLTTMPLSASEAHTLHLIDEISEDPRERVRQLWLRLSKLNDSTIKAAKQFARKMWVIDDQMEEMAVMESRQRFSDPQAIRNITNFVKYKKLPWD